MTNLKTKSTKERDKMPYAEHCNAHPEQVEQASITKLEWFRRLPINKKT